jgi:hypothetical protein
LQLLIAFNPAVITNESTPAIGQGAEYVNQVAVGLCANRKETHDLRACHIDCVSDDRMVRLSGLGIRRDIAQVVGLHSKPLADILLTLDDQQL